MKTKSSKKYYDLNPASKAVKDNYNKTFQKKPIQVKKRVEANAANRKAQANGTAKVGDSKDYDHAVKGMVAATTNRGRKEKSRVKGYKMKTKNGRSV